MEFICSLDYITGTGGRLRQQALPAFVSDVLWRHISTGEVPGGHISMTSLFIYHFPIYVLPFPVVLYFPITLDMGLRDGKTVPTSYKDMTKYIVVYSITKYKG